MQQDGQSAPKIRKIAILGTTPSRMEAPIGDPEWEIWTIGPGGKDAHRWDRLYETHTVWPEEFAEYLNSLSQVKLPQTVHSIVPMKARMVHWAHRHGKDDAWLAEKIKGDWSANVVIDRDLLFAQHKRMWFSTSICYAIVDAMNDHIERGSLPKSTIVGLWGIDLESDEEHISQFIGAAHFLDICRLVGIDLIMPAGCGLERDLNPYPDRYETFLALTYEKKHKLLTALMGQCEQDVEGKRMMLHRVEGALLKLRELKAANTAAVPDDILAAGDTELNRLSGEFWSARARLDQLRGEKSATEYYQRMFTWGMFDPSRQA